MNRLYVIMTAMLFLTLVTACSTPTAAAPAPIVTAVPKATNVPTVAPESTEEEKPARNLPTVFPVLETRPIVDADERPGGEQLGDADDPAIWVHPTDASQSIIATALKEGGLDVYDLNGQLLQHITNDGVRYNNIDILYGFSLGGTPTDLFIATDRYKDNLAVFAINPETRELSDVSDPEMALIFTPAGQESDEETTAYGIAVYQSPTSGRFYAFVNRRSTGEFAQLELLDNGAGKVTYRTIRTLNLPTPEGGELEDAQTEGMVVDPELNVLYVGQENVGIWRFTAEPDGDPTGVLIHDVESDYLEADVEGLTIYYAANGKGYLLVSSQGDNSFAVFSREGDNAYLGSFQIGAKGDIDSVEECDGAQVINLPMGSRFPQGLLVVQDGNNEPEVLVEDDGELENASTSFKFVSWADVAAAFETPLIIDTESYNPRGT